ncbi:GNAT family N-acetyltransferase [Ruegeria lacuscaerulensis]|uniref:GNAT family N-acetyltransferase n=1 Tax=Ruegeria lacuscaerulensis TaxID=55218 RepID=UPI00148080D7|nr:GNAT family N-acetyltransferase [Ruegeria lacuscaerulensis]
MAAIRIDATPQHLIDVLTLGFSSDPMMRWLFPEPHAYLQHFPVLLNLFAGEAFKNDTALSTDDGSAAALWLRPGAYPDGDGIMAFFNDVLSKEILEDSNRLVELEDELHPDESCWHLAMVASDPTSRGKGLGSALVDHILIQCDAEGKVAYLENTNPYNLDFYKRRGFVVVGEIQAGKSPTMFGMRRDPR